MKTLMFVSAVGVGLGVLALLAALGGDEQYKRERQRPFRESVVDIGIGMDQ